MVPVHVCASSETSSSPHGPHHTTSPRTIQAGAGSCSGWSGMAYVGPSVCTSQSWIPYYCRSWHRYNEPGRAWMHELGHNVGEWWGGGQTPLLLPRVAQCCRCMARLGVVSEAWLPGTACVCVQVNITLARTPTMT